MCRRRMRMSKTSDEGTDETMIRAIRWPSRNQEALPKIDFGGGNFVSAEDVLDGHLKRLLRENAQNVQSVQVQTGRSLQSTIAVSSPELVPLTDLAEELAEVVPDVSPEPQFRQELHRALELTHRQHAAQRALGTDGFLTDKKQRRSGPIWITLGLLALACLALLIWGRGSSRRRRFGVGAPSQENLNNSRFRARHCHSEEWTTACLEPAAGRNLACANLRFLLASLVGMTIRELLNLASTLTYDRAAL